MAEALASPPLAPFLASTPEERRLRGEWATLKELARLNPSRLSSVRAQDRTFFFTIESTPAPALDAAAGELVAEHHLRLAYPRYFPAVPMELYLQTPVRHPNIHPVTGFVCLWQTHRIEHSVEHALHRAAAILSWQLMNLDPRQVMQPESVAYAAGYAARLRTAPLAGIEYTASLPDPPATPRRRRLS